MIMSDYTTQLRWPVERKQYETKKGPDDYSTCYSMLGLDDYPIFDESYRSQLNDKIIRHFYFREIGFETLAQFRWYMRRTMHENMPYFNQLYNSLNLITDPITNQKYTWGEVYNLEQGGTTATDTKGTSHDDDTMDSRTVAKTDYGKTDDTTTKFGKTDDTTTTYGKTDETTTTYGKTEVDTTEYGKTDDTTTTYGKTGSKVTAYGKTTHDETTTEYGRTQHTENGGEDNNTEGGIHERVVREDTPMNLIPDGAIENLNYATEVTYTDREGTSAAVIEYGGTTDIENGGADTTTSDGTTGGRDTVTDSAGGSDIVNNEQGGTDVLSKVQGGSDVRFDELGGSDRVAEREGGSQNTFDRLGGSDTTTTTVRKNETHDGRTTGRTDFERSLDESGSRDHNRIGYDGISPSDLLKKYRETFLNVDMQVIASLETLFFGLWN